MPLVNVHMATGRTDEQKKALMAAITQAVVAAIDAPIETVRVWIDEFEPTEYMVAGETLADQRARA